MERIGEVRLAHQDSYRHRVPGARAPLGVLTEEFGGYSNLFVQRQVDALQRFEPFVVCWLRSNADVFDYEPVHVLRSGRGALSLLQRAERFLPERMRYAESLEAGRGLRRCLEQSGTRLLHIHFGWAASRVVHELRRSRLAYTVVLHGSDMNRAAAAPWTGYARRLRRALDGATRVLCASESLKQKALAFGSPPERTEVFYLGVPVPTEVARASRPGLVRIVANGRHIPLKGHRVLLEAVSRLTDTDAAVELSLIGDGPLRGTLEASALELGIADRVRFLGELRNDAVYAELRRSHLLAHPSLQLPTGDEEGLGLAVQEAMAVALPVVSTRSGGLPESVAHGESGLLVPPGDVDALAQALATLVRDPELRGKMGHAGRRIVEQRFDLERRNAELCRLLDALMTEHA